MKSTELYFDTPASEWLEGIPIGNGTLGAVHWGPPNRQVFTLNHDRLWRNSVSKRLVTHSLIPEVRRMILEGRGKEVESFFHAAIQDQPDAINAYQVFCDLSVEAESTSETQDFRSTLDMATAIASCRFTQGNVSHEYEFFASHELNLIFVRLAGTGSEVRQYRLELSRVADPECECSTTLVHGQMVLTGRFVEGVSFAAVVDVEGQNTQVAWENGSLSVKAVGEVILRIALSTSLAALDPLESCHDTLKGARALSYEAAKAQHVASHRNLFDRCRLQLASDFDGTSEQVYDEATSGRQVSNFVHEQLFHMGRYLMLSSSRPGSWPMNIQGLWNNKIDPMWESSYTTDMNMQMHYWSALSCNLFECLTPVFDWLWSNLPTMKRHASDIFGASGIYLPQYSDFKLSPSKGYCSFQVLWSGGATWLAQHFFDYWKYSGDDAFLRTRAFPYMLLCADFYKDFLQKDEKGRYFSCPSASPENTTAQGSWLVNTATMDISLVRELMTHLLEADDHLRAGHPDKALWREIIENLVDYPISKNGTLAEWLEASAQGDPGHRHISHIYGLFPGREFSPRHTPELHAAALKAIERRRENGFGSAATWSHAWYACCFSRSGEGEKSLASVDDIIRCGMLRNYFTTHNDWRESGLSSLMIESRLFQIDALLGGVSAIAEMLVQCDQDGIRLLPALPPRWPEGQAHGLRVYGGFEIDLAWKNGLLTKASILSHRGGDCRVTVGQDIHSFMTEAGKRYEL